MLNENLPSFKSEYDGFNTQIEVLELSLSSSELHGIMCGYLCTGAVVEGETFLRTLIINKDGEQGRKAIQALFALYMFSQHQLESNDFSFQLLLPEEANPLEERAQAFSEWCGGFIHSISKVSERCQVYHDEEIRDILQHIEDFAQLDYESLDDGEDDERALTEVTEYTRMAALHLHSDFHINNQKETKKILEDITH